VGVLVLVRSSVQAVGLVGAGALLLATFLWAWGTLHGRRHVKGRGLFGQVGVQMVTGGALALLLSPLNGGILHAPLTLKAALAVGYLAIFGSLVAFSAFVYISRAWAPSRMSTYVYINPVVAVLLGCLVLGEPFNGSMVLGMAAILVGVGLLQTQRVARTAAVASE
jgi:drug/metabolite transporter (DMT)-like permease